MRFLSLLLAGVTAGLALTAPTKKKRGSRLRFFGVNESGAEFGNGNLPGVYNHDYTWYDLSTIDVGCKYSMHFRPLLTPEPDIHRQRHEHLPDKPLNGASRTEQPYRTP